MLILKLKDISIKTEVRAKDCCEHLFSCSLSSGEQSACFCSHFKFGGKEKKFGGGTPGWSPGSFSFHWYASGQSVNLLKPVSVSVEES